jgi:hypothetical protein
MAETKVVHRARDCPDVARITRAHKHDNNAIGNVLKAHKAILGERKENGPDATARAVSSVP